MNKNRIIGTVIAVIVAIAAIFLALNRFYISYLWFTEMGYLDIFFKELTTQLKIGIPVFIVLLIFMFFYLRFLTKLSERYLGVVKPPKTKRERLIAIIISVVCSFVITLIIASNLWTESLQFYHGTDFGTTDAIFGLDLSFYFFKLPLLKAAYSVILTCFIGMVLITLLYTLYIMISERDFRVRTAENLEDLKSDIFDVFKTFLNLASLQIGAFLACFFLLMVFGSIIDLFEILYGGTGMVYGAGAADTVIGMKMIYVRIGLCVVLIGVSVFAGFKKNAKLLVAPVLALFVFNIGGSILQTAYEYIFVVPNQYTAEAPYIEKNIAATWDAYNLDDVEVKDFAPTQTITADDLKENTVTIENIPINDQEPTREMYNSLQGIRNYYTFNDVDVDRYFVDGTYTQIFLGTREMNNTALPDDAKTWVNTHLKYTHGFGVAMSPVNKTTSAGQPELLVKNIPPETDTKSLEIVQPRIYFGDGNYSYVITNAATPEFDYPEGNDNKEAWYEGTAGIKLSLFNRLAFALYYGSPELLFSSEITRDSRLIMHQNVMDRVQTIAPFLSYDQDPYMVAADGKQFWIIDAFTTSSYYPYAQPYDEATGKNYIQNPVKVVIDAYNGDVTFYKVEDEPIMETYAKIFPTMVKDVSEMPKGLKEHIRYSKTLFDVQTRIYATYHMNNTQVFYNKEDQWEQSRQFFGDSKEEVPIESAYTIMKLPDRQAEFMLTTTFTPKNKDNMVAWLAGVSDGDEYGKLILYQFPKSQMVYGPLQIEQRIDQNTTISPQLTLLSQQGSQVLRGNMMTIPIENAILYVEPIYIQATGGENNLPEVKKVIVSYQNDIVMADTLSDALAQIFDYDAGKTAAAETGATSTTGSSSASDLSKKASTLYDEAIAAQKSGDWAAYGTKINELKTILDQLKSATGAN